jgi:hypothetical protein
VDALPPLPPPAIEQPAPYQASYGVVRGRAAAGTRWIVVSSNGRVLATKQLRGRRFALSVELPRGDLTLRVMTVARDGRKASGVIRNVYGLPATARPRFARDAEDRWLTRRLRSVASSQAGTTAVYVQDLTTGRGAAWNAKARFPAASTLKLAIAATVLARHAGIPSPGSYVGRLLREMIIPSDDAAANALEVWLGGSTSAGALHVNALMSAIGMTDSIMYGGYEVPPRSLAGPIPVRVDEQPGFGVGKYTTAADMARLHRQIWLASGNRGRRSPSLVAPRARPRHAEARSSRGARARRERPAQSGLDLDGPPRHGSRLLAWRRLRRERDDLERLRRSAVGRRPRRARRGCDATALPPASALSLSRTTSRLS